MEPSTSQLRVAVVAALGGLGVAVAVQVPILAAGVREGALLPLAALAAAYAASPLAARGEILGAVASGLRFVGRALFYLAAYALSFAAVAEAVRMRPGTAGPAISAALPPFLFAAVSVAVGLRRDDVEAHARGEAMLLAATVLAFAAGLSLDTGNGAALVANMALAFLSVGRVVRGLSTLARAPFYEGLAVAAALVASRAVEVLGPTWARALAAGLCAAGAVAAALAFERHRARAPKAVGAAVP